MEFVRKGIFILHISYTLLYSSIIFYNLYRLYFSLLFIGICFARSIPLDILLKESVNIHYRSKICNTLRIFAQKIIFKRIFSLLAVGYQIPQKETKNFKLFFKLQLAMLKIFSIQLHINIEKKLKLLYIKDHLNLQTSANGIP